MWRINRPKPKPEREANYSPNSRTDGGKEEGNTRRPALTSLILADDGTPDGAAETDESLGLTGISWANSIVDSTFKVLALCHGKATVLRDAIDDATKVRTGC